MMQRSIITGTGSYIPPVVQSNDDFKQHKFYSEDQLPLATSSEEVVEKFKKIALVKLAYLAQLLIKSRIFFTSQ